MGGFIAAELAISFPQRVERLVLISPAGISTREPLATISPRLALAEPDPGAGARASGCWPPPRPRSRPGRTRSRAARGCAS